MLKAIIALAFVSALSGCAYHADLPPRASAPNGQARHAPRPGEPEKTDPRPTQVGIRFFFKEPVPAEWSIGPVSGGHTEEVVTPLCLLTHQTTGSRILFLLKSYIEPEADPKAYQRRILGDSAGWLETMPPAFGSPTLFGDDPGSGYVGVGSFEGMNDRWLIAAGRWRVADQQKMSADMQAIVVTLTAASTTSAKPIADPPRQLCHDYY